MQRTSRGLTSVKLDTIRRWEMRFWRNIDELRDARADQERPVHSYMSHRRATEEPVQN